jgi:hypothetical protein
LLAVLAYDRGRRPQPDPDTSTLVNKGALGGNAPDDILGGQYRCHFAATLTRRFPRYAIVDLNHAGSRACNFLRVVPEIVAFGGRVREGDLDQLLARATAKAG